MFISNAVDVAIEITRRCNMKCAHCLRGNAQNMDVTKEVIDKFFDGFAGGAYVSTILLTGGEISLNVPAVRYVLKAIKDRGITVGSFYMVTNGKNLRNLKALVRASLDWYLFCDDNEYSTLTMSRDMFHEPLPNLYEVKKTLGALSYFRNDKDTEGTSREKYLLDEGRAKNIPEGCGIKKTPLYISAPTFTVDGGEVQIDEGMVYLSCTGNVLPSCDMSYDHADAAATANVFRGDWVADYINTYTEECPLVVRKESA